jgi:Matrixin
MKKITLVVTGLVLGALLLPALAQANVPSPNYQAAAKYEARWYWTAYRANYIPCSGVRLRWDHSGDRYDGRRGWYAHVDYIGGCTIHFNRSFKWFWTRLATTMIHEYGHVVGFRHNRNPRSIMSLGVLPDWRLSSATYTWWAGGERVWWTVPSRPWGCSNPADTITCGRKR